MLSTGGNLPENFFLDDVMRFVTMAGKSILQDEFGKCFQPQPRKSYPIFSLMWPVWILSISIRYGLLLPFRLFLFVSCSFFALSVLVPLAWVSPHGGTPLLDTLLHYYMQGILISLGARVKYHGSKPSPRTPHIFVANHTSVTDLAVTSGKGRVHAVVAQAHGGMFGWLCRAVLRPLTASLLFDRNESRDRAIVSKRMRQHVNDPKNNPLLIFPEGTCVNNEYTVLFHKGAFDLDCLVCPVAIKYSKQFGDPYFNTREQSFMQHLLYLMTRWVNPVQVYWIRPMRKEDEETAVQFSDRVKAVISETAGLKNLSWDGYLKNYRPTKEKQDKMRLETRQEYLKELDEKLRHEKGDYSDQSGDDDSPILPERDYLPDWLDEDERTIVQNELLQGTCESFSTSMSSFDYRLNRSRESLAVMDKKLLKVAIWNSKSGLELKEVCRNEKMDILILEGLQVKPVNKGKSQCLKMLPIKNQKPFPHVHRYTQEKEKGAVYADFLEVSELGHALESCKRRNVKISIQVKIGKEVKFTRRQTILMSSLLWDSFFYSGDYYDRPFGFETVFDGIHFVYENGTSNLSNSLMKKINEMSEFGERKVILSSESNEIEMIPSESNFFITSAASITLKTAPKNVPFVILSSADESKAVEKFKDYKMFKGVAKKLDKSSRLTGLKSWTSRNPKVTGNKPSIYLILFIAALIISISMLIIYKFKQHKSSKKEIE